MSDSVASYTRWIKGIVTGIEDPRYIQWLKDNVTEDERIEIDLLVARYMASVARTKNEQRYEQWLKDNVTKDERAEIELLKKGVQQPL